MGDQDDFEDNKFPDNDEYIPYATAGNLSSKNGAKVTIWGKVTKVSSSEGFYVETVDHQEVQIVLNRPLDEPLEGWYEIIGTVDGKRVRCEDYVSLPQNITTNIDADGHKSLAKLLAALDDPWNIGEQ